MHVEIRVKLVALDKLKLILSYQIEVLYMVIAPRCLERRPIGLWTSKLFRVASSMWRWQWWWIWFCWLIDDYRLYGHGQVSTSGFHGSRVSELWLWLWMRSQSSVSPYLFQRSISYRLLPISLNSAGILILTNMYFYIFWWAITHLQFYFCLRPKQ